MAGSRLPAMNDRNLRTDPGRGWEGPPRSPSRAPNRGLPSGRFIYEATNALSGRFLFEATGRQMTGALEPGPSRTGVDSAQPRFRLDP